LGQVSEPRKTTINQLKFPSEMENILCSIQQAAKLNNNLKSETLKPETKK